MTTLDELLAELSGVLTQLTGDIDEASRTTLEERRDSLRQTLRSINIDERRPTSELLEEHTRLAVRIKKAKGEKVKKRGRSFFRGSAFGRSGTTRDEVNKMIDAGNRLEELEERYDNLHRILDERGALESMDNGNGKH